MLGVRDSTISNTLGVSPTHFHFWKMGSRPVPPKRQQELLKLLKDAHAIAAQAVEEYAATYKLKKDDIALVFQRTRVAAAAGVIARLESEDE
jgi:NACalpha-BTF3-like transcription factor